MVVTATLFENGIFVAVIRRESDIVQHSAKNWFAVCATKRFSIVSSCCVIPYLLCVISSHDKIW